MYFHCQRILLYRYFCRVYSLTWPMLPATFSLCHVFVCLSWHQLQHEKPGFCPADTPSATAITATATATAATAALEMGPEYVLVQPFCDAYRWGVAVSVNKSSLRRVSFASLLSSLISHLPRYVHQLLAWFLRLASMKYIKPCSQGGMMSGVS